MSKVMFSLPDKLVTRLKAIIPAGERSEILAKLLEKEIKIREELLYASALEAEANQGLRSEMITWDEEFGNDGLDNIDDNN